MVRLLIAALALAFALSPARAEVTRYGAFSHDSAMPHALIFRGEIDRLTLRDFRAALSDHDLTLLVLDSPGGRIFPALTLASRIRTHGLSTLVPPEAECASACAFLFVAGVKRHAAGRLGVHRFTSEDFTRATVANIEDETQETVSRIISLLSGQGTPPVFFVRMFETPNSGMYWFGARELAEEGLNTGDSFDEDLAALARIRLAAEDARPAPAAPPGLPPPGAPPVVGPGFDCATARTPTDRLICAEGRLAALDLALVKRVERLSRQMTPMSAAKLRFDQLSWMANRNACAVDATCIEAAYVERLEQLGY